MDSAEHILRLLNKAGVDYQIVEHSPIRGAEDAAAIRGTPLEIGGKSLLFKVSGTDRFVIVVISGARRTHNPSLRRALGAPRYRFATRDELLALTGLSPGCVPPFGRPVFDVDLLVDAATAEQDQIAFSLADPTRSVIMATTDWLAVARPDAIVPLSQPPE